MDIHRSSIKDFIMPKVKSVFVVDYYEGIQGMLASREDFPYKDFLSNPRVRTQKDITWATDVFTDKPTLLKDLQGSLKERYAYALKERIHAVEALVEILKGEEENTALSELLTKSISFIDEGSVYCGDGKVVVVNWGLIPRRPDLGLGSIYRSGKFIGNWDKLHTQEGVEPEKPQSPSAEIIDKPLPIEPIEPIEPVSGTEVVQETPLVIEQPIITVASEVDAFVPEPPVVPTPNLQSTESVIEKNPVAAEKIKESSQPEEELLNTDDMLKDNFKEKDTDYNWAFFFKNLWDASKFFVRKIFWLLLFLLLLLLLLFFCRGCQGPIHRINPFYSPLPENPVVLPIENGEVAMSADGKTRIAADRLNILLEKQGDDTMLEWAKAFKNEYDGEEYEIFYYNEDLYNLQIKVPASEREQIKKELPEKLKDFSFEVFDETVYEAQQMSFNDPELRNERHAWYLNAIGVFDAWNFTLGDPDVVVAVVDNGFDMIHPELVGKIVCPYNVLTQDARLRPIFTDEGEDAHGTHVAATAVGNCNNGSGLMGIAPKCKLMPVQVANDNATGSMSNQAVMEGVMYAIGQGADVINVSLGMYTPEPVKSMTEGQQLNYISSAMKQEEFMWNKIFKMAKKRNCVIVFAAGNDDVVSGVDPKKRNNETIRVSAVNSTLGKADFSNYGVYKQLDREYSTVSAPGVAIYSAAPNNRYVSMQGTSMAAPIVTGTVALMKSVDKSLTVNQISSILKQTGREVDPRIGPLINLGRAMRRAFDGGGVGNCEDIAKEVQKLKARIDSLYRLCPDAAVPSDTLKYEDAIKDDHGLDGLWKTTTSLVSTTDYTPVELYMQFESLSGTLTIVNKGDRYIAPLTVRTSGGKITITQHKEAANGRESFSIYRYVCFADRKGYLTCTATSQQNTVTFNLIRVK